MGIPAGLSRPTFGTNAIWRRQIQRCRNWSGSTPSVRFRRRYSPGSPAGRLFSPQTGRLIRLGADKSRPYGRKRPVPVIASQCAHWRGNPHLPSPFSMFSNSNLKTPTFSIFNFQLSILPGRAAERGRLRAVPTGARGGVHVANNVRRYGRAAACGVRGRQIAGATGGRGERGRLRKADRQNFCLCPILCPILRPILRPIMRSIMRPII